MVSGGFWPGARPLAGTRWRPHEGRAWVSGGGEGSVEAGLPGHPVRAQEGKECGRGGCG